MNSSAELGDQVYASGGSVATTNIEFISDVPACYIEDSSERLKVSRVIAIESLVVRGL